MNHLSTETPSQRAVVHEHRVKMLFFCTTLVLLFLVVTQVHNMFVSFLMSFVTYYLLAPAVDYMERWGLSRLIATLVPFAVLTGTIVTLLALFFPDLLAQSRAMQTNAPKYHEAFITMVKHFEEQLSGTFGPIDLQHKINTQVDSFSTSFFEGAPQYISNSFTVLLLTPFFSFFMLLRGRHFMRTLLSMVPNSYFELALNLNYQIGSQMGGFIRARLIESIIVGALLWTGLEMMDFQYGIVLALFAAVMNIIPYLGPIIGAVPALIIALSNGGDGNQMIEITILFTAVQVIDAAILVPFLVAKIVDLHPVTVVLAILIGGQMMGIVGMIICIPVISALKVTFVALYKHFTDFRT